MRRLAPVLLACVPLLAACGEEQNTAPRVFAVKAPVGEKRTNFERAGITLDRPANWKLRRRDPPGVFEILSGEAIVAGWAYPRDPTEVLPETAAQLEAARERLLETIEERDPAYRVLESRVTEVAGAPAIDVLGEQVLSKRRLSTRSVHVFKGEAEYVVEAIAPRGRDFALTERRVLRPLLRSLEITGEVEE